MIYPCITAGNNFVLFIVVVNVMELKDESIFCKEGEEEKKSYVIWSLDNFYNIKVVYIHIFVHEQVYIMF